MNSLGFEGKSLEETLDFGIVHIKNDKERPLFLYNWSKVPGAWKINYVKFPVKKLSGLETITKLEIEDSEKVDDPSVFNFSISEVFFQVG